MVASSNFYVLCAVAFGAYANYAKIRTSLEKSFLVQTLKYFGRPHDRIPTGPVASAADWRAADLQERQEEWRHVLSDAEIVELQNAVSYVMSRNISVSDMKQYDFKLPLLAPKIKKWIIALDPSQGLGVALIKRVPVQSWSTQESSVFWWGLGLHLGAPGAQNGRGDLIGHVTNELASTKDINKNKDFGKVRQYRTNEKIEFHCDVADVVGLLCLQTAPTGGRSRLASSVAVFNEVQRSRPDLIPRLFSPLPLDSRGDGGFNFVFVTPCRYFGNVLKTFWHTEYFRSAYRYEDSVTSTIPADVEDLISTYDAIANDPVFAYEMAFEQGDVQLISNHVVIHARTAFEDGSKPTQTRHLLRLWLSLPAEHSWLDIEQQISIWRSQFEMIANYIGFLRNYMFEFEIQDQFENPLPKL
jgi:hypothetical protein